MARRSRAMNPLWRQSAPVRQRLIPMRSIDRHGRARLPRMRMLIAAAIACTVSSAAAQIDTTSAIYRYRAAIAALLQLKPGMIAAEVGAIPGVIAPEMKPQAAANGQVISVTVD